MIGVVTFSTGSVTEVGALIISGAALLMVAVTSRKKANSEYVDRLEHRVTDTEHRLTECEHSRDTLKDENLSLMRKVLGLDSPGPVVVLPAAVLPSGTVPTPPS